MVRRTKKEFKDYNDFHDRPFPLKWGTAYAMDDLMKHVKAGEKYALKEITAKQRMTRDQVDMILSESYLKHQEVSLQLNFLDEFGRLIDSIKGYFHGEAYQDYFVINDQKVYWEDVRNIELVEFRKWSDIDQFDPTKEKLGSKKARDDPEIIVEKDENFYQPFFEDEEGETLD